MSTPPRIYLDSPLAIGKEVSLDARASHHLLQVLRLKNNDQLTLFNSKEPGEFTGILAATNKQLAVVLLQKFRARSNESPIHIHLGQGISRGEKMDFTVQKAVELGAKAITPIFTKYCNVKLDGARLSKRINHWQNIAIGAAEQSGRCFVPQILPSKNLTDWCNQEFSSLRLVLDPGAQDKISNIKNVPENITMLVGPEGGLSDEELNLVKQKGFVPINIGPRILRTETAALAAISILQARWGDV